MISTKKKKERLIEIKNDDVPLEYRQDIVILEEQLYRYRKEQEELRLKEIEIKASFIAMQVFIGRSRLEILQSYLKKTKPRIRVSELDLADDREMLSKEKKKYFIEKEQFRHTLDKLSLLIKQKEQQLENLSRDYGMPLGRIIELWIREGEKSVSSYVKLYELAKLQTHITQLKIQKELISIQEVALDKEFNNKEIKFEIKTTYHKIASNSADEELIEKENKKYKVRIAREKADLSRYTDKATRIPEIQNEYKKISEAISAQRQEIQNSKSLFKGKATEYLHCLDTLNKGEQAIKESIEIVGRLTGYYSAVLSQTNSADQLLGFIQDELSHAGGILSRPEYAVTWEGFKNSIADIGTFLRDIRSYLGRLQFSLTISNLYNLIHSPIRALHALIGVLLMLCILMIIYAISPSIEYISLIIADRNEGFIKIIGLFCVMIIQFTRTHFTMLSSWLLLYIFLSTQTFRDPYIYIFFYLLSIPYLLYLVRHYIRYFTHFNEQYAYPFFSNEFQRRFVRVLSFLIATTVVIFLFRRSFILANYNKSEVPKILLAINFIIFQTSLIVLLTKDVILSFIPQSSGLVWQWVREHIWRYYIFIQLSVIAIIVMSNPYVGFGKFVLYILLNIFYTTILIGFLWWLYEGLKQGVYTLFFLKAEEAARERFTNAKTWFGLALVSFFIFFLIAGGIIAARIWGWTISIHDIRDIMNEPLMFKGTPDPVTFVSFLKVIGFIISGFIVSYSINRFILTRIYNLFLVDSGVQHTVTSIMRYIVFIITILVGFTYIGLGQHIGYLIAALAVSVGWVLKDPINDFISYFIILVQRPIKIGDYVQIDKNTQGVVRKITPRSVILRRKNSTTLILPNSYVIGQSIENWNYSRSFIALNDIIFTIDYDADPENLQSIIFTVAQEHPNVLRNPKPIVRLEEFAEHGFVFLVRAYVSTLYVLEMWDIASDIRINIVKALRQHDIKIAIPVRVIRQSVTRHTPSAKDFKDFKHPHEE